MNHHLSPRRDGSPYVFSQRDTAEGYASALRTIGGMADEDVPLRRLASRADLESRLREHEFVIAFVNATDGTAEDESEEVRLWRRLRAALAENPEAAENVDDYIDDYLEGADPAEDAEEHLGKLRRLERLLGGGGGAGPAAAMATAVEGAARRDAAYRNFAELGHKNLLGQVVQFSEAMELSVLPPDAVAAIEDSGADYAIVAMKGAKGGPLDVYTPSCGCDLLLWLRHFLSSAKSPVSTFSDQQFWQHLTEQTTRQARWALRQEVRLKRKNNELIARGGAGNDNANGNGNAGQEALENEYEISVVLLQSDQNSEREAKRTQMYASFDEAAARVGGVTREAATMAACSGAGDHGCEVEAAEEEGEGAGLGDESNTTAAEDPPPSSSSSGAPSGGLGAAVPERVYNFIHVPYTQPVWRGSLAAMLELSHFPAIVLFDTRAKLYYALGGRKPWRRGELPSAEDVVTFISDHKKGSLEPFVRSQVLVDGEDEDGTRPAAVNVEMFTDLNFPDGCRDGEVVSAVLFHVTWCAHCKRAMGVFAELSKEAERDPSLRQVKFYTLDCDRNDCYPGVLKLGDAGANLDKLPRILVFKCGSQPVAYDGYRGVQELIAFLHKQSGGGGGGGGDGGAKEEL